MKAQEGFVQLPILIAIAVGIFLVGGGGYVGVKEYKKSQDAKKEVARTPQESETPSGATPQPTADAATSTHEENDTSAPSQKSTPSPISAPASAQTNVAPTNSGTRNDAFCQAIIPNSVWVTTYGADQASSLDDAHTCQCPDGFVMNSLATACIRRGSDTNTAQPVQGVGGTAESANKKYSVHEFAELIRQSFPAYDRITDDTMLVAALLRKYPAYRNSVDTSGIDPALLVETNQTQTFSQTFRDRFVYEFCSYGPIYCTCLYDELSRHYSDSQIANMQLATDPELINAYHVCSARFAR